MSNKLLDRPESPEIILEKLTAIFDKRYYDKYDNFTIGDLEYICISRGKFNDEGKWVIDIIPAPYQTNLNLENYTKGLPSKYKPKYL